MACPTENELLEYANDHGRPEWRATIAAHVKWCAGCTALLGTLDTGSHQGPTLPMLGGVDPLVGSKLGEYEVTARIGAGGMGIVYRGRHPVIGRDVAIKVLRPELAQRDASFVQRLIAEARAANAVGHHGIIDIFGFGNLPDGAAYFVMELLTGQSFAELLREREALDASETLELLEGVLSPLAAAHAAGVVHRDLKPSNLFVVRQRDGSRLVKVLDFGLAKLAQPGTVETAPGVMMGTLGYMAPEQHEGSAVDARADLYAVGVIAFQLLTGRHPFAGASGDPVLLRQLEGPVPRPSTFVSALDRRVDELVVRLMALEPGERPSSTAGVAAEVRTLRGMLERTEPHGRPIDRSSKPTEIALDAAAPPTEPAHRSPARRLTRWALPAAAASFALAALLWWLARR